MKILIATVQKPFVRGGADMLAEDLRDILRIQGHEVEVIGLPFQPQPAETIPDQMLACRLLDLSEAAGVRVDLVIGLRFPAYLMPNPRKVAWLWNRPHDDPADSPRVRHAVRAADREYLGQAQGLFAVSGQVARRLKGHCQLDAIPLTPPPRHAEQFHCGDAQDYLLVPGRLEPRKRQAELLEALSLTREPVRLRFTGPAPFPEYQQRLQTLMEQHSLAERVEWLGPVSEEQKRDLYARALGVVTVPHDEDFGYVALEAMLAGKPVVTCTDAGGPLEFVEHLATGLVVEPAHLAQALDLVWSERRQARGWGEAGRARYESLQISWPRITQQLLACA